ncbi:hypothetical protein ACC685_37030, partial [Rhizobium ruizarguesonis]
MFEEPKERLPCTANFGDFVEDQRNGVLDSPVGRADGDVIWRRPNYATIHRMIAKPIYGGAYAYGKSRSVPGYGGRSGISRK